jgi:hypothetical protein
MLQTPAKLLSENVQLVKLASVNCRSTTPLLLRLHFVAFIETFPALSTPAPPQSEIVES